MLILAAVLQLKNSKADLLRMGEGRTRSGPGMAQGTPLGSVTFGCGAGG